MKALSLLATLAIGLVFLSTPAIQGDAHAYDVRDTAASTLLADGQALFMKKCKKCHGADGKGQTKMGKKQKIKDMTTPEWKKENTAPKVTKAIADGIPDSKMKAYKTKLSAEEIDAITAFVLKL